MSEPQILIINKHKKSENNQIILQQNQSKSRNSQTPISYQILTSGTSDSSIIFYKLTKDESIDLHLTENSRILKLIGKYILKIHIHIGSQRIGTTTLTPEDNYLKIGKYQAYPISYYKYVTYYPLKIIETLETSQFSCLLKSELFHIRNKIGYFKDLSLKLDDLKYITKNNNMIIFSDNYKTVFTDYNLEIINELYILNTKIAINQKYIVFSDQEYLTLYDLNDPKNLVEISKLEFSADNIVLENQKLYCQDSDCIVILQLPDLKILQKIQISGIENFWYLRDMIYYFKDQFIYYLHNQEIIKFIESQSPIVSYNYDQSTVLIADKKKLDIYRYFKKIETLEFPDEIKNIDLNETGNLCLLQTSDLTYLLK